MAVVIGSSTQSDLWLLDANGTLSRLSFDVSPHRPTWTHDGTQITVGAEKGGRWRLLSIPANGTGEPIVLHEDSHRMYPTAWTADGRRLIFQQRRPQSGWDLYLLQVDTSGRAVGTAQAFAATPSHESNAALSRDGRWLAYESDEVDGVVQVYVRSFPDGGHKVRASTGGARWPVWDFKGNLRFWQTGENAMLSARTHLANGQLVVEAPEPAWPGDIGATALTRAVISVAGARYDSDPTGNRFLVLESPVDDPHPHLAQPLIVLGWHRATRD